MKPSDVFAFVVRTIGLIICLGAGTVLFWAFINLVYGGSASVIGLVIIGGPPFLVGLWLLRGAPPLISFAFQKNKTNGFPTMRK